MKFSTLFFAVTLLFGFFPYVKIIEIGSDVQPYFVIFAIIYGIIFPIFVKNYYINILILLTIIFCIIFIIFEADFGSIRKFFNYFTPFIGSILVYSYYKYNTDMNLLVMLSLFSMIFYIFVAQLQKIFGIYIVDFVINVRTDGINLRGLTSLASEPNFFGTMGFLLFFIVALYGKKNQIIAAFLMLTLINILYIKSPISYLLYLSALIFMIINVFRFKKSNVIIFSIFIIAMIPIAAQMGWIRSVVGFLGITNLRIELVISAIENNSLNILVSDQSASRRLASIFMAILGAIDNWMLPTLPDSFYNFYEENIQSYQHIFPFGSPNERPMSGFGSYIYDFGIIGLVICAIYIRNIFVLTRFELFLTSGIVFVFLFVIPMSHPFSGILLGLAFVEAERLKGSKEAARFV